MKTRKYKGPSSLYIFLKHMRCKIWKTNFPLAHIFSFGRIFLTAVEYSELQNSGHGSALSPIPLGGRVWIFHARFNHRFAFTSVMFARYREKHCRPSLSLRRCRRRRRWPRMSTTPLHLQEELFPTLVADHSRFVKAELVKLHSRAATI